jgi:aldehyde oxidoreductase
VTSARPGAAPSLLALTVNGRYVELDVPPMRRLADVLRDDLGLTGTKVGCNAGDCGACTVRLDGRQVAACLVPVGQAAGGEVVTVEGLAGPDGELSPLQAAFLAAGASQCGICTPGMLMAAADLLAADRQPDERAIADGLGGVLCRCTGYAKIVEAVRTASRPAAGEGTTGAPPAAVAPATAPVAAPPAGSAVGARIERVDGRARVTGLERYGADDRPDGALALRVIRSPYPSAAFELGDLDAVRSAHPGLVRILTAADIPGTNRFGIYPTGKDQPVLAEGTVRYRGEAVIALVGDEVAVSAIDPESLPIAWEARERVPDMATALAPGAPQLHPELPGNVLVEGRLARGDVDAALAAAASSASIEIETTFVEHAYIEPEAGWARRVGNRIELFATTQSPYMDRDEVAGVLGIPPEDVRIIPSACGGGFGGKLDQSVQPLVAVAAWLLDRPVRAVWTRPESMASSTKRHPSRTAATFAADADGRLAAARVHADFDTGAYASWGPTVANRVPVHAIGPYRVPAVRVTSRAIHTNNPPAGAFRGFGVPQVAIAHEALMDELAEQLGIDRLEIRWRNALSAGDVTASGQVLRASAGLRPCLDALRPAWGRLRAESEAFNRTSAVLRRGVGIGAMWYGIGNTSMTNPSTIELAIDRDGRATLYSGAVDIGQGASTILCQVAADALGVPVAAIGLVSGDTDRTADAGKSSASRQTYVSGNAARLAGEHLREQVLRLAEAGPEARITLGDGRIVVGEGSQAAVIELRELPPARTGGGRDACVLLGRGTFDPPTTPLDADGQGVPYATYAFGAQVAQVEVDPELGTVRVLRIVAAHDVGRAVNPTQVEGQIEGGIAQGLGLALMEAYVPGRTDNLHDYLIPTVGDAPAVDCILVEDPEPTGPYGAKGVGEPALVPTAPAILGAIHHATGARITRLPATPDRIRAAIAGRSGRP